MESRTESMAYPTEKQAGLSLPQKLLVWAFLGVGLWYLAWRPGTFNEAAPIFSRVVYGAELFGYVVAALFMVMCWRLRERKALPVPEGVTTAVFIPTINEPLDIVRRTVMSALAMDHATEVWLLDDGDRLEMQVLAEELGCRYLSRQDNAHAKAGNLNNALKHTQCDFIAVFDADHAPARYFLRDTLGFFSDERVAFVQTPQDFYNLDSFQHRHDVRGSLIWSEQTLFFRVIQAGKDNLDAAFFCGSCGVVRRKALEDIGGFAHETVTEDLHTSIRLHKRGWKSVYYGRALAFGIAPSSVIPFLRQRLRWGQGAMQVWRMEGLLFTRGLSLKQRIAYLATYLQYFEGWQRAVFFFSPAVVLLTGLMPISTLNIEFLVHFVPYYLLSLWVFEEVSRGHGRTLLTEQYNILRFAIFITATFGLFFGKLRFRVTPKQLGEKVATDRVLWPQYFVLSLCALAIPVGIGMTLLQANELPLPALAANVLWAGLTCAIAISAIRYARRASGYTRREYRFPLRVPARFPWPDGRERVALATDISPKGFRLAGVSADAANQGERLRGQLLLPSGAVDIIAHVRSLLPSKGEYSPREIGCEFEWVGESARDQLELFLFGSDLQWELNGLSDRVPTPLERLTRLFTRRGVDARTLAGKTWWPVLYRHKGSQEGDRVGFISAPDKRTTERTVITLGSIPENQYLLGREVTLSGLQTVVGRVEEQNVLESRLSPIYIYRLAA